MFEPFHPGLWLCNFVKLFGFANILSQTVFSSQKMVGHQCIHMSAQSRKLQLSEKWHDALCNLGTGRSPILPDGDVTYSPYFYD